MKTIQVKQYNLQITPILVQGFYDLGNEITDQFKVFYHSFLSGGAIRITESFIEASKKTFSNFNKKQRIVLSDAYFNNFTVVTENLLASRQYGVAFRLWTEVLAFVKQWEDNNKPKVLHKGTPYYFSSVASILQNDFDAAMMSMHNALIEDKLNSPKWDEAPGYWFLTLNDQKPNQYFKPFVDGMVGFIRDRLDGQGAEQGRYKENYQNIRGGRLTHQEFRSKFLDNKFINDGLKYFFVYSIIRIWHLRRLHKSKVGDELMAPLIFTNGLFTLLLVLDNILKSWNNPKQKRWNFAAHLFELAKHEGWISSSVQIKQYIKDLDVSGKAETDFNKWCKELLRVKGHQYKTTSNRILGDLEADFVLAYGLRNFSAHTIKSQKVLWENYTKILQAILNCLFKTIELI